MKIKSLHLDNFQGIVHAEFDFDGLSASIYGDNATGKTTVFNAVTWLLFDKASTGAANFNPKTKGPNGDLHNLDHSAEASFIMPTGEIATFKKVYHEIWKKKRGSATEEFDKHTVDYYIDGAPKTQTQYTATIENCCGGIKRMMMLTMPDYFAETMNWKDRREILLELCGDVTDTDVIRSSEEFAELDNYLRKPGTANQFYSVEEYQKIATDGKKKIAKDLQELTGSINEARRKIPEQMWNISDIDAGIARLNAERQQFFSERAMMLSGNTSVADARKKTAEAETALASARSAYINRINEANAQTTDEITRLTEAMGEARTRASEERTKAKELRSSAERMASQREALRREYADIQAQTWDEAQAICPTCGQRLPAERIEALRSDFNLRRSEQLTFINEKGKSTCSQAMIEDASRRATDAEQAAAAADSEASLHQTRITALRTKLKEFPAFETTQEYFKLSGEITCCRIAEREVAQAAAPNTTEVDNRIRALDAEVEDLQRKKAQMEQAEMQRIRIGELENLEKQHGDKYENFEHGIWLCNEFTNAKVRMLTSRIDSKFKSVRFRLFQEQLNGGVKDDCEVLIPGEGGRMVPYSFANNAARINAGLEIIGVLADHWKMEMPVFIDNAESVTHLARTWTQTIRLVVSEKDRQLRLELD